MNLAKEPEGTHTHIHFIPRTPGGKNYGDEFSMEPSTYVPIDEQEKESIVNTFRQNFSENLLKRKLKIDWPVLEGVQWKRVTNSYQQKGWNCFAHSSVKCDKIGYE